MRIDLAFPLEQPRVELRWGLREAVVRAELAGASVTQMTPGHLKVRCRLLGGLEHDVHLHFSPRIAGALTQLELYRKPTRKRQKAFDDWQARLEVLLGPSMPLTAGAGVGIRYEYEMPRRWRTGKLEVVHEWYYLTGQHERIRFTHARP
jgi:hypothetical protein